MVQANPGLALRAITSSKGADYRPFAIEGAFGDIELKRLEKQVELIQETQALTHGDSTFGSADEDSERKAWQKPLPFGNDFSWVYSKLQDLVWDINQQTWNFDLLAMLEPAIYLRYKSSEKGKYDFHVDCGGNAPSSYRKMSIIVLLSDPDDYEGGDVLFQDYLATEDDKMLYPKTKGTILFFPSFLRHAVTPVTKGERRSLVLWVHGKPFR